MVTNSRATTGVDSLRPLNIPVAVQVKAAAGGIPVQMKHSDLWMDITKVTDRCVSMMNGGVKNVYPVPISNY